MKPQATPFLVHTDPQEAKKAGRPVLPDEDELIDEEAFYLAQQEAFADFRARNERRPRKKM